MGKTFIAPVDVLLDEANIVQPDILVILGSTHAPAKGGLQRIPDLVVEILSPSSFRRDLIEKRDLYAHFGVKEYWLVNPANRYVEVNTLISGRFEAHATASDIEGEKLPSEVSSALLPDLLVRCGEVFGGVN